MELCGKYTEESSIVLKDALYKALNIEADENAMQEAVDEAILKLDEAIKSLVEKMLILVRTNRNISITSEEYYKCHVISKTIKIFYLRLIILVVMTLLLVHLLIT